VEVGQTLVERKAGEGALQKARELETAGPQDMLKLFRKGEEESWRVGAFGEQRVAKELTKLPP
jgi:hypothetical protein